MIEASFHHEVGCQDYKTNKDSGNFAQGQIFPTQTKVSFNTIIIGYGTEWAFSPLSVTNSLLGAKIGPWHLVFSAHIIESTNQVL